MKKFLLYSVLALSIFSFAPTQVSAASGSPVDPISTLENKDKSIKSEALTVRLNEIKSLDKSDLNFSEKRALRKETRSIKRELKDLNGGVYISAGSIILIAILLIILL
jgi:hypothetical protein